MGNNYTLVYTKKASKDAKKYQIQSLRDKAIKLCESLITDPFPVNSKKLHGDLKHLLSIRITLNHRLIYTVDTNKRIVKIVSIWGHFS